MARMIWYLRIGAVVGFLMTAWFSLLMAGFASDDPSTPVVIPIIVGTISLAVTTLPAVGLPWLALRRLRKDGAQGLTPAIIFGVFCLLLFPLIILGALILFEAYLMKRRQQL